MQAMGDKKIIFVSSVGHSSGYGHYIRCLNLAKHLHSLGYAIDCYWLHDKQFTQKPSKIPSISQTLIQSTDVAQLIQQLSHEKSALIIFDIMTDFIMMQQEHFLNLFKKLKSQANKLVLFDSPYNCSLRAVYPDLVIDAVIVPYIGELPLEKVRYKQWIGPAYFILPLEFKQLNFDTTTKSVQQVLLTCGGSDVHQCTSKCLNALNKINSAIFSITVVTTDMFSADNIAIIQESIQHSPHQVTTLHAPDSLYNAILAADWIISLSGLTKYEIAALAKPSIIISPDLMQSEVNIKFAEAKTALHYHCQDINAIEHDLVNLVELLISDPELREQMSNNCKNLIDTQGIVRVSRELANL